LVRFSISISGVPVSLIWFFRSLEVKIFSGPYLTISALPG
jgi:hypothetical protein